MNLNLSDIRDDASPFGNPGDREHARFHLPYRGVWTIDSDTAEDLSRCLLQYWDPAQVVARGGAGREVPLTYILELTDTLELGEVIYRVHVDGGLVEADWNPATFEKDCPIAWLGQVIDHFVPQLGGSMLSRLCHANSQVGGRINTAYEVRPRPWKDAFHLKKAYTKALSYSIEGEREVTENLLAHFFSQLVGAKILLRKLPAQNSMFVWTCTVPRNDTVTFVLTVGVKKVTLHLRESLLDLEGNPVRQWLAPLRDEILPQVLAAPPGVPAYFSSHLSESVWSGVTSDADLAPLQKLLSNFQRV